MLCFGSGDQVLLHSAACTISDQIVEGQTASLPGPHTQQNQHPQLPNGADSYLIISSTLLLPCLLVGLSVRNEIYTRTVSTNPGIFFTVVAAINAVALLALCMMRTATDAHRATT